ncbi:MAG: metallophosphoesterase [Akkermansiaceae bacterium]|nr:metallophosphoesterase [Akkermansiaceae bacterium]
MPIHLNASPAPTRRRFLATAAAAAAFPVFDYRRAGAAVTSEVWALLSDTHIAADPGTVSRQGVNMAENLNRVVAEVVAEAKSLAGVMIDGDCAHDDGQPGDYGTLAQLLKPLADAGLPIHMTLGNHDDRGPFFEAFASRRPETEPVEGKHIGVIETPLASWILLDSLRFVNKVEGEFGAAQLEWLAKILDQRREKPVILVGHHYPQVFREDVIPGDEKIKISGLVDTKAFEEVVAPRKQAKIYIYGHSHDWKTETGPEGLHHANLPPTAYVFKPERPNGWVRATVTPGGMKLELRALDPKHPEHGQVKEFAWR